MEPIDNNEIIDALARFEDKNTHRIYWTGTGNSSDQPKCYCNCGYVAYGRLHVEQHEREFKAANYHESHDALKPVLAKLSEEQWNALMHELYEKYNFLQKHPYISFGRYMLTLEAKVLATAIYHVVVLSTLKD